MTDTANAPERIWTADTTGNCSVWFNTPSLDYKNEYISRAHCDELVAAAYLDAGWKPIQTAPRDGSWFVACAVSPEFSVAKVVHFDDEHDRFPITGLRDEAWARAPTHWMPLPESAPAPDDALAALTARDERMQAEGVAYEESFARGANWAQEKARVEGRLVVVDSPELAKLRADLAEAQAKIARLAEALEILRDNPAAVHINMLKGSVARPTWEQIKHLYCAEFKSLQETPND